MLVTSRLKLCVWDERHRLPLAAMLADPEVMQDYGGPFGSERAQTKYEHFRNTFEAHGFCRWALEDESGRFLGYAGVMPSRPAHPLGPHADLGFRLVRDAWGFGYATEAARAALDDFFARGLGSEVLAYTTRDNARSQAVMQRLGLERDGSRDYSEHLNGVTWFGLVWVGRDP